MNFVTDGIPYRMSLSHVHVYLCSYSYSHVFPVCKGKEYT